MSVQVSYGACECDACYASMGHPKSGTCASDVKRPPMFSSFVALSPEQEEALDFARTLEERVSKMAPFAPGKIALSVAAKNLRDYVAATM